jgi:hypothetical protein
LPFMITLHAPHWPSPQPTLVPVRPSDHAVDRQIGGPLHYVLQFPHVAWPGVGIEKVHQVLADRHLLPPVATESVEEMLKKQGISSIRSRRGGMVIDMTLRR